MPSVLWCCWLGGKGVRPLKNWVVRYWCGYLSGARCKWFAYGPADATATRHLLLQSNPECFTFLVPVSQVVLEKRLLRECSRVVVTMLLWSNIRPVLKCIVLLKYLRCIIWSYYLLKVLVWICHIFFRLQRTLLQRHCTATYCWSLFRCELHD